MSPEAVRAGALAGLSPHADPRAREALARGEVVIVAGPSRWEGARGPVSGVRVGLGVSAGDLAGLVDAHSVRDALVAAVASSVAAADEASALEELVLFWSPAARVETGHYRGALAGEDLGSAVVSFLRARGEAAAAEFARAARFSGDGAHARVHPPPPTALAAPLDACLSALLVRVSPP